MIEREVKKFESNSGKVEFLISRLHCWPNSQEKFLVMVILNPKPQNSKARVLRFSFASYQLI